MEKISYTDIRRFLKARAARITVALCVCILGFGFWTALPEPLFDDPYSTVLTDKEERLLGARIADDGQWRFPLSERVPEKFEEALLEFEDQHFYYHPGIDPVAVLRAALQNIEAGEIVSGASTLTMQIIRLSRKGQPRTYWEKIKEVILAVRLELSYSKEELLALYAAHAPFGGNVVGLEAAAWRYFGRPPSQLSWAEATTLSVLPNSPSLIHPGRNRNRLKEKRDHLLGRLLQNGTIDSLTYRLSLSERLPDQPLPLPRDAPRLLDRVHRSDLREERVQVTIDKTLQVRAADLLQNHQKQLSGNQIHNVAAVIAEVNTGKAKAYIGNAGNNPHAHGMQNDMIMTPRSTGSILKPFLYMLMMNEGRLLPDMLVADIPTHIADYAPKNFSLTYDGAVPASEALSRSLNVPSVRMLREYGVPNFHHHLQLLGMQSLKNPPEHYGLSLILGGAEGTLWDITGMYASLARHMNHYNAADPETQFMNAKPLHVVRESESPDEQKSFPLNAGAVWKTFETMLEVNRPENEVNWQQFASSRKIGWKTGTSFGFRDGWAIGVTPEYVIGVWAGNADGEGRPGLIGIKTAGPILFDLFDLLEETSWFREPLYATSEVPVCAVSGHRAGPYCTPVDTSVIPKPGLRTEPCPYHRKVHLNPAGDHRVSSKCMPVAEMNAQSWFVLPPIQEWYYRKNHSTYASLPPYLEGCKPDEDNSLAMELIYPHDTSRIYVPRELDGSSGRTVFEVAHRNNGQTIYWHLNNEYLGKTKGSHQMDLSPDPGRHVLTLVDEEGSTLQHRFEILSR